MDRARLAGLSALLGAASLLANACGETRFSSSPTDDDAGSVDGATPTDHDVPDSAPGDAADIPFCATHHDLCDDFEDTSIAWPLSHWDSNTQLAALTLTMPGEDGSGHALHVQEPGDSGADPTLQKTVVRAMTTLTCQADLRVDAMPATAASPILFNIRLNSSAAGVAFIFFLQANDTGSSAVWVLTTGTASNLMNTSTSQDLGTVVLGAWQHLAFTLTPSTGALMFNMPGIASFNRTGLTAVSPIDSTDFQIGVSPIDPAWSVHFDNLVCDESP
ncbi:MAG: hypothetical protein ABI183_20220 [Polyangiaceae bacterium]